MIKLDFEIKILLITFAISVICGIITIPILKKLKIGQIERDDGPASHLKKQGTPTMGGIIIILSMIIVCIGLYIYYTTVRLEPEIAKNILPLLITSVGFGLPTKERFDAMRKDILGDLWNEDLNKVVEHINPLKLEKKIKQIAKKRKYKRNGREYKLPTYYKRRIFYVKDPLTGKMVQSTLSKMVSKAVQMDVQSDFSRKLIELATRDDIPETYEGRVTASKIVCASEERNRQERAEMLFQTNIAALRKSRF